MGKNKLDSEYENLKLSSKLDALKKKTGFITVSLLFPVKKYNLVQAKAWAKKQGYKISKIAKSKDYIHVTQTKKKFDTYKTIHFKKSDVKARIARIGKFEGKLIIKGFSKFSEDIQSEMDLQLPMSFDYQILKEGQNRDGIISREELEESVDRWGNEDIIDFHDASNAATQYKMSDVKGYTIGQARIEIIDGIAWVIVPGEITNRELAYQIYMKEKIGRPLQVSAEYGWQRQWIDGELHQTNINPHLISVVPKGHIQGNKMVLTS